MTTWDYQYNLCTNVQNNFYKNNDIPNKTNDNIVCM